MDLKSKNRPNGMKYNISTFVSSNLNETFEIKNSKFWKYLCDNLNLSLYYVKKHLANMRMNVNETTTYNDVYNYLQNRINNSPDNIKRNIIKIIENSNISEDDKILIYDFLNC
jgi:hypothetical protein